VKRTAHPQHRHSFNTSVKSVRMAVYGQCWATGCKLPLQSLDISWINQITDKLHMPV